MTIWRNSDGFTINGKTQTVLVRIVIIDGVRHAAIYEGNEQYPTYIQPFHDADLYRIAYRFASTSARYEFHPHG